MRSRNALYRSGNGAGDREPAWARGGGALCVNYARSIGVPAGKQNRRHPDAIAIYLSRMHRFIALIAAAALIAGPALAQDKSADKPADAPRFYQADTPVTLSAAPGAYKEVVSDPLTQVNEIALQLRFTCAPADCDKAGFQLQARADALDSANLSFQIKNGTLQATSMKFEEDIYVQEKTFKVSPKPNETLDVRIHWTSGGRVTFDIYRKDPDTGATTMESQDVQLGGYVADLATRVSGGDLTILKQSYRFR